MERTTLAWLAFGAYLVITTGLALRGMRKTKSLAGFALGNGDMGPLLVGITLAASVASTATFVINPGFVWKDGLSALLHFGLAGAGGVTVGLIVLSKGFRRLGKEHAALTLPHWLGSRYRSPAMRTYFALLNLALAISFVVLIIKGSALVMQVTLGLSYGWSVVLIVGFVFSYILMGGTYAHAYTNALQGTLMIVVALAIFASGLHLFADGGVSGFMDQLAARDPQLTGATNASSFLFSTPFEVFVCGFVVSFGLVCQPHILMKSLYLRSDRDVNRYLVIAAVIGVVFALILVAGLYARVAYPELDGAAQDTIMASYIGKAFSPVAGVLISVALLAAGMSTMDGILVSASTIAGSDLFLGALGEKLAPKATDEERQQLALKASRAILVAMGAVAFVLALNPPELVGLFAQTGIYGLVAASLAPVTFGVFAKNPDGRWAFAAALVGPAVHFTHFFVSTYGLGAPINPAVTATEGVAASTLVLAVAAFATRPSAAPLPSAAE
ncbi:MAG: sodium:solute symporter [Sandaracinus sp.]|nr:sodium:solute symporter [Sandaracinus sp.]MBJ74872.1 sodium:solute symporter [Sandaracinus sp.]HJL21497.1 sodium:solute symporter family protein [Polyangiaceae bacterium LLY-WYZ-15_(1-7)]HJL35751.1 sodium:solute symporter family protein [Polyangiaceae bacterium LLY-WYZ-15_(1-7)]HJL49239.1 sodium:solute symporter family protein [Polyangiaceae bacterium LLY-WYZ-15_(1-7)]